MKRLLLFFMAGMLWIHYAWPQSALPPSPDAISMVNSGALYTGSVPVVIPIATLNSRQLSTSISLSYSGGGVKVSEVASCVGLGFGLNYGGVITRVVKGKPDDDANGYLYKASNMPVLEDLDEGMDPAYADIVNFYNGTWDGESDIFYYNFGGRAGSFVFDRSKNIRFLTAEKLDIDPYYSGDAIDYFIVKDEYGVSYTFNSKEKAETDFKINGGTTTTYSRYTSSWFLSSISSPDGTDQITFS